MQKTLVVLGGINHGQVIPLLVSEFRIGRDSGCHLRPASTDISRLHCAIITRPDGRVFVRDYGSVNGTIINERYLIGGELQLQDSDVLEVGPLMFRFHCQTVAATTASNSVLATTPNIPVPPPVAVPLPAQPRPLLPGLSTAVSTVGGVPGRGYKEDSVLHMSTETYSDLSDSNIFSVRDKDDFRPVTVDTLPINPDRLPGEPGEKGSRDSGPMLCQE